MFTKKLVRLIVLFALIVFAAVNFLPAFGANKNVYVAPIEGTIDGGTYAFLERIYQQASADDSVILKMDTPGGYVWAAEEIRKLINDSPAKTITFVKGGATSAGAYIALSSEEIVMTPGSTIGAAEPRIGYSKADAKTISYWSKQMAAAAEKSGRNPELARAMADAEIEIPGIVRQGEILTLTFSEALEHGMADAVLSDLQQVIEFYQLEDAELIKEEPGLLEGLARWVSSPYVSGLLLTIGLAGLIIEIFTMGFGIPGSIGLISLGLYFFGHMLGGMTGYEALLLFLLGLALIAVEIFFIPGFGIAGIGGLLALIFSVVLAAPTVEEAVVSLIVAFIGTGILLALSIKFLPTRRAWNRLILGEKLDNDNYVAPDSSLRGFVGSQGEALTPLRPSGTAEIEGKRVDVVTSGEFITEGSRIEVVKVEGVRVVVRELKNQ